MIVAMDARVVVGAPAAEETPAATARGVGTPSPVPSAPSSSTVTAATGNGGVGGTVVATLTSSASCVPRDPSSVVVVASPSSNHQQPAGVVAALPRILSRNVNGTRKFLSPNDCVVIAS